MCNAEDSELGVAVRAGGAIFNTGLLLYIIITLLLVAIHDRHRPAMRAYVASARS